MPRQKVIVGLVTCPSVPAERNSQRARSRRLLRQMQRGFEDLDHWSVSYAGEHIAVCLSHCAIGIDIALQGAMPKMAEIHHFFSHAEQRFVDHQPRDQHAFEMTRLWTLKEAIVKMHRLSGLNDFSKIEPDRSIHPQHHQVIPNGDSLHLSLVGRRSLSVQLLTWNGREDCAVSQRVQAHV